MINKTIFYNWLNVSSKRSVFVSENIIFMIDGEQPHSVLSNKDKELLTVVGFSPDIMPDWNSASKIVPFDKDVSNYFLIVVYKSNWLFLS